MESKIKHNSPRKGAMDADRNSAEHVAILVCHGMGQQVPFETIEGVANNISSHAATPGVMVSPAKVGIVELEGKRLPRAEVDVTKESKTKIVHIYEAYWAPATEGRVTLRDVHSFLMDAGFNGIRHSLLEGPFTRWLFGGFQVFTIDRWRTALQFALALAVVWALTIINTAIVAVAAAKTLSGPLAAWPSQKFINEFAVLLLFLSPLLLVTGILGACCQFRKKTVAKKALLRSFGVFIWLSLVGIMLTGIGTLGLFYFDHNRGARFTDPLKFSDSVPAWLCGLVIVIVVYASAKIRWFLIQYVGDVAAYISPYKVSKFNDIRKAIREESESVARAIYSAKKTGTDDFAYDKVLVVGHSLGSVVAYDTLNAMILEDQICSKMNTIARTAGLITFGSPLDKTAYIFRTQAKKGDEIREALAAAVQPLIVNGANRPFNWTNIYSPQDWISGELDFYDLPNKSNPNPVINLEDPLAVIPLAAHTQYWNNPVLATTVLNTILL